MPLTNHPARENNLNPFSCNQPVLHATNETVKAFAFILTLVLWTPYLQGGLHELACCCNAPAEPVSCCAAPAPQHTCDCSFQNAAETPAQPAALQEAPRGGHNILYWLPPQSGPLFRPSENARLPFPTVGNDPPHPRTAFLQIWRC
jgi:hypothetical protein